MGEVSKWWYFAHAFFWFLTGLLCYLVHRKKQPKMAKKHLIRSIWLCPAVWIPISFIPLLVFPEADIIELAYRMNP